MSFPPFFPPQPALPEPDYRPPLAQHLQAHRRAGGPGFTDEGLFLPDDPDRYGGEKPIPGFEESTLLEITPQVDPEEVEEAGRALLRLAEQGGSDARARVEMVLEAAQALWLAPALAAWLRAADTDRARLRAELRQLLLTTSARETAKTCLWLLAEAGHEDDAPLAELFATHGEFARYGAHTLAALAPDAPDRLWALARAGLDEWARIYLVGALARFARARPEIRAWLLRDGVQSLGFLPNHTALTVARQANLAGALATPTPDDALLRGAGVIFNAMRPRGAVHGLDRWRRSPLAARRYLDHLAARPHLHDEATYFQVAELARAVRVVRDDPYIRAPQWTPGRIRAILRRCAAILHGAGYTAFIREKIVGADSEERHIAQLMAGAGGHLRDETGLDLLGAHPDDGSLWLNLAFGAPPEFLEALTALAAELFAPEIATGATTEDGWPPRATRHGTTHALLNVLAMQPGAGWPLIALALRSPFVAVRREALQLLADWPTGLTPVQSAAVAACRDDPSAEIRHLARQLLAPR